MNGPACLLMLLAILVMPAVCLAQERHRIGVSIPLTGVVAGMGEAFRRGAELYLEEHTDESKMLDVAFDDHRYDGKFIASSCQKFSSADAVELLIVWGNTPAEICAPIVERSHTPSLMFSMNADAKGRQFLVTLGPKLTSLTDEVVEYLTKQVRAKKPASVSINIGNALEAIDIIKDGLGGNLTTTIISNDEQDFRSAIVSLKGHGTDAVFLILLPAQALSFARQAAELGFTVPILGGDVFADEEFERSFVKFNSQLAWVYGATEAGFIDRVRKRYGSAPYPFESACGYTAMQLASRAIHRVETGADTSLIEALKKVELSDTPITDVIYRNDAEFGAHFEAGYAIYHARG